MKIFCDFDALFDFLKSASLVFAFGNIANCINTGKLKLPLVKIAERSRRGIIVESAVLFGKQTVVNVMKLYSPEF